MTRPDPVEVDLDIARQRYPVGDHVTGTVTLIPRPVLIGLFVDLGQPPIGFVDLVHLKRSVDQWPGVGTVMDFEVLQHRNQQVRLWPLDEAFRWSTASFWRSEPEWQAVRHRYPVGSEVIAEITDLFPANREYAVIFDGVWSVLPWTGRPPVVGAHGRFVVDRHLDATHRVLLRRT